MKLILIAIFLLYFGLPSHAAVVCMEGETFKDKTEYTCFPAPTVKEKPNTFLEMTPFSGVSPRTLRVPPLLSKVTLWVSRELLLEATTKLLESHFKDKVMVVPKIEEQPTPLKSH